MKTAELVFKISFIIVSICVLALLTIWAVSIWQDDMDLLNRVAGTIGIGLIPLIITACIAGGLAYDTEDE